MLRTVTVAVALLVAGTPVGAQREQDSAYRLAKEGTILQLGDILAQVGPHVAGKYIGSEFDADRVMYRLRYMDGNIVRIIDVDARTGRIVGRK